MRHLLTIASDEFGPKGRWLPAEDRDDPRITGQRLLMDRDCWAPHGLMLQASWYSQAASWWLRGLHLILVVTISGRSTVTVLAKPGTNQQG
jgi:hypothetical protein